jgi:putative flippase GtrA
VAPVKPGQTRRRPGFGVHTILTAPQRHLALLQLALYLVVGGICFCIDIGGFIALRYVAFPILAASATSFVTATLANYLLCCAFVFRSGRFSRSEEILRLFAIAVIGLGLNSATVWFLAQILGAAPTLAKILAVFPVLAWNYFGRRSIVFDGRPSAAMALLAGRVRVRS